MVFGLNVVPLTTDQGLAAAGVLATIGFGGSFFFTVPQILNMPRRKVALALDGPLRTFKLSCSQSLADEISNFTGSRSEDFFVTLAEPGDSDLFLKSKRSTNPSSN